MENFHKTITDWLTPLGYTPIYDNHPCSKIREWHFSKEGIRVICVDDNSEYSGGYCYLYADILKPEIYTVCIKTMKFPIGTEQLEKLHNYMLEYANVVKLVKIN
jgi:hypothetical protein